jgi:hypothetical protein
MIGIAYSEKSIPALVRDALPVLSNYSWMLRRVCVVNKKGGRHPDASAAESHTRNHTRDSYIPYRNNIS